jgi:hypothetical protein
VSLGVGIFASVVLILAVYHKGFRKVLFRTAGVVVVLTLLGAGDYFAYDRYTTWQADRVAQKQKAATDKGIQACMTRLGTPMSVGESLFNQSDPLNVAHFNNLRACTAYPDMGVAPPPQGYVVDLPPGYTLDVNGKVIPDIDLSAGLVPNQQPSKASKGTAEVSDSPTVKETLHWMQTSLESGAGDYSVGHEVRSWRLEDFVGCRVHFSYSTHQEPFVNGEPAPDKKPYRSDHFFSLGDIDSAKIRFKKGPGDRLDVPSVFTILTRNDEKKITSKYPGLTEADDTSLILTFDSVGDNDYVVRFATAFKHTVEACGGKPSLF